MDNTSEKDIIRRRDVPWHRNGTIMKYIFMLAGLSIVCGMFVDPEFAEARPGVLDALIGLVVGNLCGRFAGRIMARGFERDTRDRISIWQDLWKDYTDPSRFAFAAFFFIAVLGGGLLAALLSRSLHLGFPWFGRVGYVSGGAVFLSAVFYWISTARTVERWYLSLPE
jgi:hypothetical protein